MFIPSLHTERRSASPSGEHLRSRGAAASPSSSRELEEDHPFPEASLPPGTRRDHPGFPQGWFGSRSGRARTVLAPRGAGPSGYPTARRHGRSGARRSPPRHITLLLHRPAPLAGQQAFSQGPSALPPPQTQKNPKRRSFKLVLKAGRGSEPSFNRSETQAGSDSEVSGGIQFASMAVEMEKEKHELVIPKPSNSWKSTGTPFAALSSLSRLKQAAQTLPMRSAHPRCKKANRKPNKRT